MKIDLSAFNPFVFFIFTLTMRTIPAYRKWHLKQLISARTTICAISSLTIFLIIFLNAFIPKASVLLPSIDVLPLLLAKNIPNTFIDKSGAVFVDNSLLYFLGSVYKRWESKYLTRSTESTVVIRLKITWFAYKIALEFVDGLYDFSMQSMLRPKSMSFLTDVDIWQGWLSQLFHSRKTSGQDRLLQQYLSAIYSFGLAPAHSYAISQPLSMVYGMQLLDVVVCFLGIFSQIALLTFILGSSYHKWLFNMSSVIFATSSLVMLGSLFVNAIFAAIVYAGFPSWLQFAISMNYFTDIVLYGIVLWIIVFPGWKHKKDIILEKKLMKEFIPSECTSVYEDLEKGKEDDNGNEELLDEEKLVGSGGSSICHHTPSNKTSKSSPSKGTSKSSPSLPTPRIQVFRPVLAPVIRMQPSGSFSPNKRLPLDIIKDHELTYSRRTSVNSVTTMDLENRVQKIEVVKNLSPRKVIKTEDSSELEAISEEAATATRSRIIELAQLAEKSARSIQTKTASLNDQIDIDSQFATTKFIPLKSPKSATLTSMDMFLPATSSLPIPGTNELVVKQEAVQNFDPPSSISTGPPKTPNLTKEENSNELRKSSEPLRSPGMTISGTDSTPFPSETVEAEDSFCSRATPVNVLSVVGSIRMAPLANPLSAMVVNADSG